MMHLSRKRCSCFRSFFLCLTVVLKTTFASEGSIHEYPDFIDSPKKSNLGGRRANTLVEEFFDNSKKTTFDKKNDGQGGLTESLISGINTQLNGDFTKPLFVAPSLQPSLIPSSSPSLMPSEVPSIAPSSAPSYLPTRSSVPTFTPTLEPTSTPTNFPTLTPTLSIMPTLILSSAPTVRSTPVPIEDVQTQTTSSFEKTSSEREKTGNAKRIYLPIIALFFTLGGAFFCFFDFEKRDDDFFNEDDDEHDPSLAHDAFVPSASSTRSSLHINNQAYEENELNQDEEDVEVVDFTESGSAMGESESLPSLPPQLKFLKVDEHLSKKGVEIYADTIQF